MEENNTNKEKVDLFLKFMNESVDNFYWNHEGIIEDVNDKENFDYSDPIDILIDVSSNKLIYKQVYVNEELNVVLVMVADTYEYANPNIYVYNGNSISNVKKHSEIEDDEESQNFQRYISREVTLLISDCLFTGAGYAHIHWDYFSYKDFIAQ